MAFLDCEQLQAISVSMPVTFIGECCFLRCRLLSTVTFCDGSYLTRIANSAFGSCDSLQSITLPSYLENLAEWCFNGCKKLASVYFPPDSVLARIEGGAFGDCLSLESLVLPSHVEFVGKECFYHCIKLSDFAFASPSRLRQLLDIPMGWRGLNEIPDSVEVIRFMSDFCHCYKYTLRFGPQSKLKRIMTGCLFCNRPPRAFLQVASRTLKAFRQQLEFEPETYEYEFDEWE
jgi:hypothetical protein